MEGHQPVAFVTGGSGFIGARLIALLRDRGWKVRGLARTETAAARIRALGAVAVPGDLTAPGDLVGAMDDCSAVFHSAVDFRLWGTIEEFRRSNVEATRNILNAAVASQAVRRFVYVSAATIVFDRPRDMIGVDETAAIVKPRDAPYTASKAESEELVLAANGARAGFETVAVRPPFVWGPAMPSLDRMLAMARTGRFRWIDHGRQIGSFLHVDNLATVLLLAAERGSGGEAYFASDGDERTYREHFEALFATRGLAVPTASAPFAVAWALAGMLERAWRMFPLPGEPPLTRQTLHFFGKTFTVDIAKARKQLGYVPAVTFEGGLAEMR